ncbi:hypothetical protein HDE_11308 [Halotydeus destructor]|nr:hypothetical protein HDE_11308 [Halotydeus destructor]
MPSTQKVTSSESEKPATPTERVEEEDKVEPSQESGKSPETGVVDLDASTVPGAVDEQEVGPPLQSTKPEGLPKPPVVDLEDDEETPEKSPIVEPSPDEVTPTKDQSALIPEEPSIRDISSLERKEKEASEGLTVPKEVTGQEVTAPLSDDDDGIYLTARSQVTPPKVDLPKPPKLIILCQNVSGTLNRLFPDPRLGNSEVTEPRKSPRKPATPPTSPPQGKSPEGQKPKSPLTKKLTGKRKSSLSGASSSGKTTAKARKIVSPRPKTPDSSEDEDGMSNDGEAHATNAKVLFTAYEPRTNRKESGTPLRESRFNCVRCREHGLLSTQYGEAINLVDHFCPYEQCCCPTCKASKKSSAMKAEEVGDGLYKQKDSVFVDTMRGKVTVEDTEIGKQIIGFCKENQVTEATTNALLDVGGMYLNEFHVLTKLHESRQYTNFPVELLPFLPNKRRETIVDLLASADTDSFVQIKNYDQIMADLAEDNVKLITLTVSATLKEGPDSKQYFFGLFALDTKQKTLQFEVLAPIIELGNLGSVRLRSLLGVALETEAIVDAMKYGVGHVVSTLGKGVDLEETPEELLDLFRKDIEKCDIAYILAQYVLHSTIYSPALEKRLFNYELFYRINWYAVLTHTHFSRRVERYLESILVDHWLKKLATPMRKINRESRHYFHVDDRKEIREDRRRRVEVYGQHVEALMKSTGKKPNFAIVKERMSTWRKSGKHPKEQLPGDIH